jgi:hypothetical protein
MKGLTTALLSRACQTYLDLAYPGGPDTIPPPKSLYYDLPAGRPLQDLLLPPVCQVLPSVAGHFRGYSFRLGSAAYPHLKLQVVAHDDACLFMVDTHDTTPLGPAHPDAARWAQLQQANRHLKEQVERAWEEAGLLTFNGLLRRELDRLSQRRNFEGK